MREAEIEKYLRTKIEAKGGLCLKFVSPGNSGVPDRLVIYPKGQTCFVELKAPGKELRPLQSYWLGKLIDMDQNYAFIFTKECVDNFIEWSDKNGYF